MPYLNSGGALWSLIRPRWISLVAVQCVLLWSIPKTGIDLPQSRLAVVTLSQATSQALKKSAINIPFRRRAMEVTKFKATQEPIKALYSKDANAAFLTLRARGSASESTVTCKVETGRGLALAGIHPKAGGTGQELCSGDMLLEALIACAGVSMRAAAAVLEIPINSAIVSAEGDVDLRGTLGVTEGVPVGFKEIRLLFDIDSDATREQLDQLIELTDRYCVIFQTIQNSPRTRVALNNVRHQ